MSKVKATYSLSERDKKTVDTLAGTEHFASKSDVVRTALRVLTEVKPEYRTDVAVELYRKGEVSLGKAAEIAGVDRESFKEILSERGLKVELEPRPNAEERLRKLEER